MAPYSLSSVIKAPEVRDKLIWTDVISTLSRFNLSSYSEDLHLKIGVNNVFFKFKRFQLGSFQPAAASG